MIKSVIKKLIGPANLGRYDYLTKPELISIWGGAFNGQEFRQQMFDEIMSMVGPAQIVETGAFRGDTTEYLAATGLPVTTVEFDDRIYGFVSTRHRSKRNVEVHKNDSRKFLSELAQHSAPAKEKTFFYLDAHWDEDLPLAEELLIVFQSWPHAVVMIDDFCVPQSSYKYDDYGAGKALTLDYVAEIKDLPQPAFFFPAIAAEQETGMQRGSVVLSWNSEIVETLKRCRTLTSYQP